MARLSPISVPKGVEVRISGQHVNVKGSKGVMEHDIHDSVSVAQNDSEISFEAKDMAGSVAQAGTARALLRNMMIGVSEKYKKKLELVGVGYRAQAQGQKLNLTLGFSHPVVYQLPDGVSADELEASSMHAAINCSGRATLYISDGSHAGERGRVVGIRL